MPVSGAIDLIDADAVLTATDVGSVVLAQGDLDGDGRADALVGAPFVGDFAGTVYVVAGETTGELALDDADMIVRGTSDGAFGTAVAAGDVDGDGFAELLVGACDASDYVGAAYLLDRATGTWTDADARATFVGERPGDFLGWSALVADLNGDTRGDLLLGAPFGGMEREAGVVYVAFAP